MKNLKYFIPALFLLGLVSVATAAPTANILRTILPETTNTYDIGSSALGWKRLFFATSTAGCATFASTGELYSVGSACGSGSGSSTFGTTSISVLYPILWNTATAVLSLAFGTTTSNTWANTQTFTNAPVLSSLSGLVAGSSGSAAYAVATSSETCSDVISCAAHTVLAGGGAIATTPGTFGGASTYTFPADLTISTFLTLIQGAAATPGGIKQDSLDGAGSRYVFVATSSSLYVGELQRSISQPGDDNTYIGYKIGVGADNKSRNTFVGALANTTPFGTGANDQVGVGYQALRVSRGNGNIAIGSNAAIDVTNGTYNIALGAGVDFPSNSGSQQLDVGNLLYGTGLYNSTTASAAPVLNGAIGVGSTTPWAQLSVHALDQSTNTTLFAIASSTASATTTLFSINNTGSIFTQLSNGCVQTTSGVLTSTGTACGTLTLAALSAVTPIAYNSSTGVFSWTGLATTSQPASSNLLVSNGGAGVYGAATSSETCSGVVNCAAHTVLSGGGAITVTGGTNGQVLGWLSGVPTWTASSSIAAGTGISISAAGAVTTITNTGVISNSCPGGFLTCSGTNPSSFTLGTLAIANGGTNATSLGSHMVLAFDGTRIVSTSTPTIASILATSTTATSTLGFSVNLTNGGAATNKTYLTRLAAVYSTITSGSGTVVFTGARDSAPSFSGSTLTLPNNTASILVKIVGGGGAGAGSGGTGVTDGTAGGNSTFSTMTANGGLGGSASQGAPQAGGSATGGDINLAGGGASGANGLTVWPGSHGGVSVFGGNGWGNSTVGGGAGSSGTGSGGAGGGSNTNANAGGGGTAGGYSEKVFSSLAASYSYSVGAAGVGGNAGTGGGGAGGAGGTGQMIIYVYTY